MGIRQHVIIILTLICVLASGAAAAGKTQCTSKVYLSGIDKDSDVRWDFFCSSGRNSGRWTDIKVPSCWETEGFGTYYYGWEEPFDSDETGLYRHRFKADRSWRGKSVEIVFEGSMTDTEVMINGRKAGPKHEGGFYRFSYDISLLLKYGHENLLEVTVRKCPANESVYNAERQTDFWLFGGIYRPVYLEIKPREHISSLAVDARADGSLSVRPYISPAADDCTVTVHVETLDGTPMSGRMVGAVGDTLRTVVSGIKPWTQETPELYRLVAELSDGGRTVHRVEERIGFRTVEFRRGEGFFLNGRRIVFKGVNRHSFWPESGRTLSRSICLEDAKLIKEMNMNAVRMSHYPPDKDFLEICDSIGLLVIDELCGWQKKYDTPTARRLAASVVTRDRNHPSVVLWANGNEGGWNTQADDVYPQNDLQHRFVIHPWERFAGTDTKHYPDYDYVVNSTIYDHDVFFPTEFMHGLFDGGAAASLSDFWDMMMKHRAPAGGFIWALLDEGLVRMDMNDSIDCKYDLAPDGILGPHREKEGSFGAIREIWSPVKIVNRMVPATENPEVGVENSYMFIDLKDCRFSYSIYDLTSDQDSGFTKNRIMTGTIEVPSVAPGERRNISLSLPAGWTEHDIMEITVEDPHGHRVYEYSRPIADSRELAGRILDGSLKHKRDVSVSDEGERLDVKHGDNTFSFDKRTGLLMYVIRPDGRLSLNGGPVVVTSENKFKELTHRRDGDNYIVEPVYDAHQWIRWIFPVDGDPRVEYTFSVNGKTDYIGIGIDYPEDRILGMEWIGDGPYRVWKNRLEGVSFGVHSKTGGNTVTGEDWTYPEFRGYHADCRAVTVRTAEGDFTLVPSAEGMFFQMLRPQEAKYKGGSHTAPPFPATNLGFMYAIPAIGTKFQSPDQLGPSGMKNMQLNYTPFSGSIHFIL